MYTTARPRAIELNESTLRDVEAQMQTLAEESVEYVYGPVIQKVDEKGNVVARYEVEIFVKLVRR